MTKLIPRAEALRVVHEWRSQTDEHGEGDANLGLDLAYALIEDIPAIGTCATCAEWGDHGSYGYCRYWKNRIMSLPDHYCAAWKARGAK